MGNRGADDPQAHLRQSAYTPIDSGIHSVLECDIWAIPHTLAGHRVYGPPGGDRGAESTNARVFVGLGLTS